MGAIELLKTIVESLMIPMLGMVYSVQGRLSRLEGKLETFINMQKGPQ